MLVPRELPGSVVGLGFETPDGLSLAFAVTLQPEKERFLPNLESMASNIRFFVLAPCLVSLLVACGGEALFAG